MEVGAQAQQKLKIEVVNQPLNVFLLDLRENYGFQLVYDEDLVSKFTISISEELGSKEKFIAKALKGLDLTYKKSGDVIMVLPKRRLKAKEVSIPQTKIQGQVLEASTYEPLPFSNILVNNQAVESDLKGYFSFIASNDTAFSVQISHLGYYIYDTVFTSGLNQKFYLNPSFKELGEVVVKNKLIEKSTHIGDKPGNITMNHNIAPYLPGYGDNSVFNLVRLMPGVMASGEQSADLIIWGSYEGQSKTSFDQFTVFGLKNYNDNIGVVNPLIIKNIEVYKGGYGATFGDRVGGIVNISGKDGNRQKPGLTLAINNSTINSLLEVPIKKKSTLQAAFRKTYYELYDPARIDFLGKRNNQPGQQQNAGNGNGANPNREKPSYAVDFNAVPDYNFADANVKYSLSGDNGDLFYISLYGGGDDFAYDLLGELTNFNILRQQTEKNRQKGASAFYGKTWGNGNSGSLTLAYSSLENNSTEENSTETIKTGNKRVQKSTQAKNNISEAYLETKNKLVFPNGNSLQFGLGFIENKSTILSQSFGKTILDKNPSSQRVYTFLQNKLPLGKNALLKVGARASYSVGLDKLFMEPKLSFSAKIEEKWKFNAAWGMYNQYISQISQVDSVANYSYLWTVNNEKEVPVLKGEHLVGSLKFFENDFTVCLEGFYKKTNGVSRFHKGNLAVKRGFYSGNAKSYGLDIFIKKEFKGNMFWASYTLSKAEEKFSFYRRDIYRPALHDQRHELKIAGIVQVNSFYFSANYVFGSGFEKMKEILDDGEKEIPTYNRLDASVTYKFKPKKFKMEAGLSILNVLNHENLKFSNLSRVSTGSLSSVNVYTEAVPFSPSLFLKLMF